MWSRIAAAPNAAWAAGCGEYTRLLRRRAAELEAAGQRSQAMGATFPETFLRRRLASSAHACEASLRNRLRKVRGEALEPESDETAEDTTQRDLGVEAITLPDGRTEKAVLPDLLARAEQIPYGQEASHRVQFRSPGHVLVQSALRHMCGKVYAPGFHSRMSYRKVPGQAGGGFLFTYALRFVDGCGETVEEHFEIVGVGIDGRASADPDADLRRFLTVEPVRDPNLSPREAEALLPILLAAFPAARTAADAEAARRQGLRARQMAAGQEEIAEKALIHLGRWS